MTTCPRCQGTGVLQPHRRKRLRNGERLFWCSCAEGTRQRRRRDLWVSLVWAVMLGGVIILALTGRCQ